MIFLRGLVGIPLADPLEFRLMGVTVIGALTLVDTEIFHQGKPLQYGAEDELEAWILIDDQWWNNVPPGPEGCVN